MRELATVARHRFFGTLSLVTVVAALSVFPIESAQAGIASSSASGDITLSGPVFDTTGPVIVPTYPGYSDSSGFGPLLGVGAYMAETRPVAAAGSSGPFVPFIPTAPPSFTPTFLSEGAGFGATETLTGHVDAHYVLDGAGLSASVVSLSYPYIWAAGASSLVTFDVLITFADADGVFGPPDDLHFHVSKTSSVGGDFATAGPVFLPALPAVDPSFDVHATFTLTAFSAPGDGAVLIKTFGVPEPSALVLAAIGLIGLGCIACRRNR